MQESQKLQKKEKYKIKSWILRKFDKIELQLLENEG